jgi:hypothetical protein
MLFDMDKLKFKKRVIDICVEKTRSDINLFRDQINDLKEGTDRINEDGVDEQAQSHLEEGSVTIERLNKQLALASDKMAALLRIQKENPIHRYVSPGAIVKTSNGVFFVVSNIEKLEVEKTEVLGLSVQSPLYKAIEGKTKGEEISFHNKNYKILDVY